MGLDLEQVAILLQRRYGVLREIYKLTQEMQNAVSRQDEVSLALLLDLRAEEMAKYDTVEQELWKQAEKGHTEWMELKRLLRTDPEQAEKASNPMENKIFEIRRKSRTLLGQTQQLDQIVNRRVTGKAR